MKGKPTKVTSTLWSYQRLFIELVVLFFLLLIVYHKFYEARDFKYKYLQAKRDLRYAEEEIEDNVVNFVNNNGDELSMPSEVSKYIKYRSVDAILESEDGKQTPSWIYQINSNPPFLFALPPLKEKEGVQMSIQNDGVLELPTQNVFRYLLKDRCKELKEDEGGEDDDEIDEDEDDEDEEADSKKPKKSKKEEKKKQPKAKKRPLVLDVGANLGYFTTYSAKMGCRVISFEAQPRLLPLFKFSIAMNGLEDQVTLYNNIITDQPTAKLKIVYQPGCWACSFVEPVPAGQDVVTNANTFLIPPVKVDDIVQEDVLLMKIDIEGFEVRGLESSKRLLTEHNVENILIEWSPSRWPRAQTTLQEGWQWLEKLYDMGYVIRHYELRMEYPREGLKKESFPIMGDAYEIPRDKLKHLCEFLAHREANLWFSKERNKGEKKERKKKLRRKRAD
eukprot:TRINITY_DN382_c1_g3_i1.p1 TRINITY_DN382_c1_g3~~TRINITY_DN382_c1_g3_i1.p1  ORF type:complete len:447 (+),score=122.05 TRINITY_DN382_c1_g3_i1:85-1425(+)